MKAVTKENAIQKVEDQNVLLRTEYIGSEGCRCVIGHLIDDYEIENIVNTNLQNRTVDALDLDLTTRDLITLCDLQQINDRSEYLEDFLKAARNYMERHYELTRST